MQVLRLASLGLGMMGGSSRCIVSAGWIDEDTPEALRKTTSLVDGTEYELVMSDEFNVPDRSFADGEDPTWTALTKSDDDFSAAGGGSLHFYNSSAVSTTDDGMLTIRSLLEKTEWNRYNEVDKEWLHETKHFKSGMIQSWNKFCFTGGIVEVDIVLPGEPDIGGLWPAVWMLGNLGRATYEGSTNNIWPWSYDTCDREKQQSQAISGCNSLNHFGLNPHQGRGATEIDIVELMAGDSKGEVLPNTDPPISLPYLDLTLQVAPGITENRPTPGYQPVRESDTTETGFITSVAQSWYSNLTVAGNTSLNPFFYGTYLAETKPEEPVTRNKKQAFQADAVGAMKQVVGAHFKKPHTFRIEWQPGRGGRIDWFTKSHKVTNEDGTEYNIEGDGKGQDWEASFSIPDSSIQSVKGSKIPEEPTYLIMNTAISSTWGFPYDVPDGCPKCYDCEDPKCACSFNPGFCSMMKTGKVSLKIDSVRVYQSKDDSAHVGQPHSLGCDPPKFPTREFIKGYEYRYMRDAPFDYDDKHPLKDIKNGGKSCEVDEDCGGVSDKGESDGEADVLDLDGSDDSDVSAENRKRLLDEDGNAVKPKGTCAAVSGSGLFSPKKSAKKAASTGGRKQCKCNEGYTGPNCLSVDKQDDQPGAYELKKEHKLFTDWSSPFLTRFHVVIGAGFVGSFLAFLIVDNALKARKRNGVGAPRGVSMEQVPLTSNTVPMGR